MYKRIFTTLTLSAALLLSACTSDPAPQSTNLDATPADTDTAKHSIVTVSFHEYDWVNQILGDNSENFEVTLLMDTGVDIHSYEPSVEEVATIQNADLFIYNGGPSHDWVTDIITIPANDNFKAFSVVDSLGELVMDEVAVEGMQIDGTGDSHDHEEGTHDHEEDTHDHEEDTHDHEEETHDHEEDTHDHEEDTHDHEEDTHDHEEDTHDHEEDTHDHEEDTHDHSDEAHGHEDEHVWLSLSNAMLVCESIAKEISALDTANAEVYTANAESYIATLEELNTEYETAIAASERDTLIFADRFPFLYLMSDYDINYYAAFQGCAAETEATFETIKFLAEKVDELDINTLLVLDNGLIELAETVNNSSEDKDSETATLHSMQSVSTQDIESGATYYTIMQENLEALKLALAE